MSSQRAGMPRQQARSGGARPWERGTERGAHHPGQQRLRQPACRRPAAPAAAPRRTREQQQPADGHGGDGGAGGGAGALHAVGLIDDHGLPHGALAGQGVGGEGGQGEAAPVTAAASDAMRCRCSTAGSSSSSSSSSEPQGCAEGCAHWKQHGPASLSKGHLTPAPQPPGSPPGTASAPSAPSHKRTAPRAA